MALLLKFDICEETCKTFVFTELTGAYNATTNTTGWGTPNAILANATAATLAIYYPGNSTTTPSLTINLFTSSFPTTTTTQEYTITNTALGLSGKLTDGLWKFVYTVTVSTGGVITTYQQTIEKITTCNAKCCVDGLYGIIDDFECDCMDEAIKKAEDAHAIYMGMVSAARCGNIIKFTRLQAILERLCNNTNCCS